MLEENLFKTEILSVAVKTHKKLTMIMNGVIEDTGLTLLQTHLLLIIERIKGEKLACSVGELAKITYSDQGNISTACKKLDKLGYLKRERNEEDERVVNLFLTDKGRELTVEIDRRMSLIFDEVFSKITHEKKALILDIFKEFYEIIDCLPGEGHNCSACLHS